MIVIKPLSNEARRAAQQAESERIDNMLSRDRADIVREQMRQQAEWEIKNGNFQHVADTVVPPTPEWLEQGDVQTFTPRQLDGTTRVFQTVRRVRAPVIVQMHRDGRISDEQYTACTWYCMTHEQAGLEGRFSSSQYSATSSVQRSAKTGGFGGHMAMHANEAEAREAFRFAREAIDSRYLAFFDQVVLGDVPLRRTRFKAASGRLLHHFTTVANQLVVHCRDQKITVVPHEVDSHD